SVEVRLRERIGAFLLVLNHGLNSAFGALGDRIRVMQQGRGDGPAGYDETGRQRQVGVEVIAGAFQTRDVLLIDAQMRRVVFGDRRSDVGGYVHEIVLHARQQHDHFAGQSGAQGDG